MKLTVTQVKNYLSRLGISTADGEAGDLRTALPEKDAIAREFDKFKQFFAM